ncbi:MAG: radical SAM protein [Proteobacteria bacterium]|nr:radical SAM protein [Pseudomonadota bacterium]
MIPVCRTLLSDLKSIGHHRSPGQVIVQITDRCNAMCPHCGMRISNPFRRSRLSNDQIKKIIDAAAANGVAALSFTGGEPLLCLDDLTELIQYAGHSGIRFIRTGTNGFFMRINGSNIDRFKSRVTETIEKLASTPLRNFWISMDSSVPEVHEAMRGLPGVIGGIEKAIPIFHAHGLYPSVNLGVNRNIGGRFTSELDPREFPCETDYLEAFYNRYREAMRQFYKRVINMGFTIANTCYPMSIDTSEKDTNAVYAATATDRIVRFTQAEKAVLFKVLMDSVTEFRSKIRIFSPLTSLFNLHRQYSSDHGNGHTPSRCLGGIDYFFIDANKGNAFPCGYRGNEDMGKYWDLNLKRIDLNTHCKRCDWECFRDPSEQIAPLLQLFSSPLHLIKQVITDRTYFRFWMNDLRYYRLCQFFDGRKKPNMSKLAFYTQK